MSQITINKKLLYDYEILEKYQAGLKLTGPEVKAVKKGSIDLKGSYASIKINPDNQQLEAFLYGVQIAKYSKAGYSQDNYRSDRARKLLLKKGEINTLAGKLNQKGLTLLPLSVYTTAHRLIKIELVLARGKKKIDKREQIKKREFERRKQKLLEY